MKALRRILRGVRVEHSPDDVVSFGLLGRLRRAGL